MFQRRATATVGFCLGLVLLAMSVGPARGGENHTLRWDRILDSTNGDANGCNSDRFKCIMPTAANPTGEAVLDLETGLVWERSTNITYITWTNAIQHCAIREVGGRKGWSLPMREQLASLVDTSNFNLALTTGHPFLLTGPSLQLYWSATTDAASAIRAWIVQFIAGEVQRANKDINGGVWCARGGQVFDGNTHTTLH